MRTVLLAGVSLLALSASVVTAAAAPIFSDSTPGSTTFTVKTAGMYEIEALGAEGGVEHYTILPDASGGSGADISGQFALQANEQLSIVVGRSGYNGATGLHQYGAGGGGGGTFVVGPGNTPLLIAGGGGGGGSASGADGDNASNSTSGTSGNGRGAGAGGMGGAGGQGGNPYYKKTIAGSSLFGGAGGGGLTGNGGYGFGPPKYGSGYASPYGGNSFANGSAGGAGGQGNGSGHGGAGGVGGGGGGAGANVLGVGDCGGGGGGGGGYSGGGGGGYAAGGNTTYCGQGGGAGGSFNSGIDQVFKNDKSGHGYVAITYVASIGSPEPVPEPASLSLFGVSTLGLLALRRRHRQR